MNRAARRLQQRLNEIRSAERASDLFMMPGRWHELAADRRGQLSGDLKHPLRFILEPAHQDVTKKDDSGVNWDKVTEVVVVEIVDTH